MTKIKFVRHPRSIVRKRHDYPTSLFATIPKPIVTEWELKPGDLLEYVFVTEGSEQYVKVRMVTL